MANFGQITLLRQAPQSKWHVKIMERHQIFSVFLSVSMTNFCIFKIPRCSKSRHRLLEEYKPLIDMDTRHDQSFMQRLYFKLKGIMPKCIVNEQRINNMLIFQFKL